MWTDKKMYWQWTDSAEELKKRKKGLFVTPPLPTIKKLDYVTINKGTKHESSLCIGVWGGDKYTALHRDELEFSLKQYSCTEKSRWPQCNKLFSTNPTNDI